MSIIKIICEERKAADFQRCDTDFEIMQVNTQMLWNGWERGKKIKIRWVSVYGSNIYNRNNYYGKWKGNS